MTDYTPLEAVFTIKKMACGYCLIVTDSGTPFLILDKRYGYDLIPTEGEEPKAFRTLSEIVQYIKNK